MYPAYRMHRLEEREREREREREGEREREREREREGEGERRVDWYDYWAPTVPGDELVRFRLEYSTSMYEQSTNIFDQARFDTVWTQFSYDCLRFQVRSSTVCYGLVRLNTTFTWLTGHLQGLHTVQPTFVRVRFHTIYIRYWHGWAHSWSGLHVLLYIRSPTDLYGLSWSCTIANTIIHRHGTCVSFLKVFKMGLLANKEKSFPCTIPFLIGEKIKGC